MLRIFDIIASLWASATTGGEVEASTVDLRAAGEKDGLDEREAEIWSHYGLAYRPPAPDDKHTCQALTLPLAGRRAVVATRDTRAADAAGALNEGDVALWSVGKNAVRVNADGSMALLLQGESTDAMISIEKNGAIILRNEWGQLELGPKGFQVLTTDGASIVAGQGKCQMMAPQCLIAGGSVGLGVAPTTPLTFAPASGVPKPSPSIFV
jgi:hypothetical protein